MTWRRPRLKSSDVRSARANCEPDILRCKRPVFVVTSTFGDGQPPEDAAFFCAALVRGNGLYLSGIRFAVLALGDSTYDHFCQCGRDLDAALERHGATRAFLRIDCDTDFDGVADCWIEGALTALSQRCQSSTEKFSLTAA
ncbi:MAG: flavodoxin domain-containing protein [Candidatus Binatia bacterium]